MPEDIAINPADIRRAAMNALARREHSRQELFKKLLQRFADTQLVSEVLDALCEENLQSDQRYTEAFIRYRKTRGQGPIRIAADLRSSGISEGLLAANLDSKSGDWQELAREVYHKRFGQQPAEDLKALAKQQRFLQYRGFTHEHIKYAIAIDV
jgi:regulatory protein